MMMKKEPQMEKIVGTGVFSHLFNFAIKTTAVRNKNWI
jgi:hypothetical protein